MLRCARDPRTRIYPIACSSLRRRLPQAQMPERAVDAEPRELFLHAVLVEPRAQIVEVHAIEVLVLVEAGKYHAFDAAYGVAMDLQALRADFLHHALHRRVDGGDRLVPGLEMRREHSLPRLGDRPHHAVRADRDAAIDLAERDRRVPDRPRSVGVERRDDVADEGFVLRPRGAKARGLVAAPHDDVGRPLDLFDLVTVDRALVAGKIEHAA